MPLAGAYRSRVCVAVRCEEQLPRDAGVWGGVHVRVGAGRAVTALPIPGRVPKKLVGRAVRVGRGPG